MDAGIALVTGGARRIGRAIVERLAREKFAVIVHASARSLRDADVLAGTLRASGARATTAVADLADARETSALIEAAARTFGAPTLLVNNASVFEADEPQTFAAQGFERAIAVNLRAPALLTQAFAAALPTQSDGVVVNIIDQRVLRPDPYYFSYSLSKAALLHATKAMAQAYAPRIRVNAVGPGPVLPNQHEGQAAFDAELAVAPLGRAVAPEEVADAVLWLAKAPSVTGQMIAVDSGQHLAWK
ncbi:MAG: SDR family oxidoreductase [Hyphomicrobiales bacterium]|nr:SDR family oxidoreductase [Hyphomicrobiales bacterium]